MGMRDELEKLKGKKVVVFTPGLEREKTKGFVHEVTDDMLTLKLEVVGTLVHIPLIKISKFFEPMDTTINMRDIYNLARNDYNRVQKYIEERKPEEMVLSEARGGYDRCVQLEGEEEFRDKPEIQEWKAYFKDICEKCGVNLD